MIDYTFYLEEIITKMDKIEDLINAVDYVQESIIPVISSIWTLVTIILPLIGVIGFLWWFFKQFLYQY